MNYFIFEKNIFQEGFVNRFKSLLIVEGICFSEVEVLPFSHEIIGLENIPKDEDSEYVFFGSIGGAKMAKEQGWKVWDKNFGVENYKKLGDKFLNNDAITEKFCDINVDLLPELFFIRPESDNKKFSGTLITKDNFIEWRKNMIEIGYLDDSNFPISIASPKNLNREVRCVVRNGKLITASQYRTKYSKIYKKIKKGTTDFIMFGNEIKEISKMYEPDEIYCIDFGEIGSDEYKVIEYNCFNSAGLYNCDEEAVFKMFYGDII